jgi:hypothetical protein
VVFLSAVGNIYQIPMLITIELRFQVNVKFYEEIH